MTDQPSEPTNPTDFVRERIRKDVESGKVQQVVTRFPPEPNGYLHIGHAKAITVSFSIAAEFDGRCNLRFDDTNPEKEDQEFVDAIQEDVRWLGFEWSGLHHASDYYQQLYDWAEQLVEQGVAYVDDQNAETIAAMRGTVTEPGTNSPCRDRSVAENLDLLRRMKAGEFGDGEKVLRARIDMAHPNLNMRDPVLYRIRKQAHQRTGTEWCIYPMYDWAHGQSDSIEGVTHSLCTLEFEHHRPLYDWCLEQLGIHHPQQIEFARLNVEYMLTSKRRLLQLVQDDHVDGWDDPRMPTLRGMRRRGYPPEALVAFCKHVGLNKFNSTHEVSLLDHFVRDWLNKHVERRMAVLDPVELVIDNWPEGQVDLVTAINNPEDEAAGTREVPFSGRLYIEREDFMEEPVKGFFRLAPDREVRLRYGYFVKCTGVDKDGDGNVTRIHCTYDPETRGGNAPDGRKVKATLHWVSADHAADCEVRLYDQLFTHPNPAELDGDEFVAHINPTSRKLVTGKLEPSLAAAKAGERCQFERLGYFCVDSVDSTPDRPVFVRTTTLKDPWKKKQGGGQKKGGQKKGGQKGGNQKKGGGQKGGQQKGPNKPKGGDQPRDS